MAFNDYQFGLNSNAASTWQPGVDTTPPPGSPVSQYKFGLDSDAASMQSAQFQSMPVARPMAHTNQQVMAGSVPGMDYYVNLGSQIQGALQPMGQQQAPQMAGDTGSSGFLPGSQAVPVSAGNLTSGFNHDWLAQRLDAGSANGAAIGGIGKNPGGGKIGKDEEDMWVDSERNPGVGYRDVGSVQGPGEGTGEGW